MSNSLDFSQHLIFHDSLAVFSRSQRMVCSGEHPIVSGLFLLLITCFCAGLVNWYRNRTFVFHANV